MYYSTKYSSPLGMITIACDKNKLVGLWIDGQKYHGDSIVELNGANESSVPLLGEVKKWLDKYFSGKKPSISDLPLAPAGGSEFRKKVWNILCEIPYGKVITYGDIAKEIAAKTKTNKMSGQAVGRAVGHNPISIIIPCHRVVGANGNLTGYAGGIEKKIKLLELEGVDMSKLYVPKKGTAL